MGRRKEEAERRRLEDEEFVREIYENTITRGDALHEMLKIQLGEGYHPEMVVRFTIRKNPFSGAINDIRIEQTNITGPGLVVVRKEGTTYEYLGVS